MRVKSTLFIRPLLALAVLAIIFLPWAAMLPASASLFDMPKLDLNGFSFGSSFERPATTTIVDKSIGPFDDLARSSGIAAPFGGFGLFRSPVTSRQSYTRTVMTPEGPQTQTVERSYDGTTGERMTTVTNV